MKWNIDKALAAFEPESCPGTTIQRVLMDVKLFSQHGLKMPRAPRLGGGSRTRSLETGEESVLVPPSSMNVWSLGIGYSYAAKAFFYGHTIRECFLKARKAVKAGQLAAATPWGQQGFEPKLKKPKPRVKVKPRAKEARTT